MNRPAFRFAPSPNGELHLGHAYSALLNEKMARGSGGRFLIRIEDIDTIRCTAELTAKALADLEWLGLEWEEPVRIQSQHFADFHTQQQRLTDMGLLYPCFCTRKQVGEEEIYPGTCRHLKNPDLSKPHALRLDMAKADPGKASGDPVLVRKDIGTSYHLAVVTDDHLQGITHVVRGADLEAATPIHKTLQRLLGFATPHYHHHKLIGDEAGKKLSKSAGSKSLRALREEGVTARQIKSALGF